MFNINQSISWKMVKWKSKVQVNSATNWCKSSDIAAVAKTTSLSWPYTWKLNYFFLCSFRKHPKTKNFFFYSDPSPPISCRLNYTHLPLGLFPHMLCHAWSLRYKDILQNKDPPPPPLLCSEVTMETDIIQFLMFLMKKSLRTYFHLQPWQHLTLSVLFVKKQVTMATLKHPDCVIDHVSMAASLSWGTWRNQNVFDSMFFNFRKIGK